MTIDEYEQGGKALYADFAHAIEIIIIEALKSIGTVRTQAIQRRAKAPPEVRKKLDDISSNIETKVKDLAGVRIVVYTNSDVARLNNSGLLSENFDIVWDRTKIHYPHKAEEAGQSQFIGQNYVVRLKDNRGALPEYRRFAGLQCEVQVQTILDHAWSETAHDTIYKSPKLNGVGAAQMAKIKDRMRDIQQKYLLPAGYEFQQVLNDFEKIVSGQLLIESDILNSIVKAEDNNFRVELLKRFKTVLLPVIDDPLEMSKNVRSAMVQAARNSISISVKPLNSPIGTISGYTINDVLESIISILSEIRYIDPDQVYNTYCELFIIFDKFDLRQKIVKAVGEIAEHNFVSWQKVGPAVQATLIDQVRSTPQEWLSSTRPLMIEVARNCLESEITGASSTSTEFIWQSGSVTHSDLLDEVRDHAIGILKELFQSSQDEVERTKIYLAMQSATRLPTQVRYSNSILTRVFKDTSTIISFLIEQSDNLDDLLKEKIEHDTLFHYWRVKDIQDDALKDQGVRQVRSAVIAAAQALRQRFNADDEYVIFKTLVGFDAVFNDEWDEDPANVDYSVKDARRKECAAEYLTQVTDQTADTWFDRLNRYGAIKSNDWAMFPLLAAFIKEVAEKSSVIATSWIERSHDQPLLRFRPNILSGLYKSDSRAAMEWIDAAIDRKDDLIGIAHFIRHVEPATPDVLDKIARVSIDAANEGAVYFVLEACAARSDAFGVELSRKLAIDALTFLSESGHNRWTEPLWLWNNRSGLLAHFNDADRAALFAAIVRIPQVDYRVEEILTNFWHSWPESVLDIFGKRLERERSEKENASTNEAYRAFPWEFTRLQTAMQYGEKIVLQKAIEWHRADPKLGRFRSAYFVAKLFPTPSEEMLKILINLCCSGASDEQDFVLDIMSNYKGEDVVYKVLKELVAAQPGKNTFDRVGGALNETGVMEGEFGYRDALAAKKQIMTEWLSDERAAVKHFAEGHLRQLENAISAEQQRADNKIAMRKLHFGEPLLD